jgi:hypothetical protein
MTTTIDIATQLVDLVKAGKPHEAVETLYSPDIVTVEAASFGGEPTEQRGIAAVRKKSAMWRETNEVHSARVDGPWPNGNRFVVRFTYDVTNKQTKQRSTMDEAALYVVEGGKIVHETFFYRT